MRLNAQFLCKAALNSASNIGAIDGNVIQVGVSLGQTDNKPQASMNGLGYGSDSDSDSSVTRAGITGIAGSQDITTDNRAEYAGILENSFDANQVNKELGAQVEITQAFDQERRKIKTEINAKEQKLRKEAEEQGQLGNTTARDKLIEQADKVQNQGLLFDAISGAIYGPNTNGATGYIAKAASPFVASKIGTYFKANEAINSIDGGTRSEQGSAAHILAQGILGAAISYATGNDALTGGVSAGSGEATAPLLSQFLYGTKDSSKLDAEQKDTISAITSALGVGIGATTGGASNAANAAETSKVAVEDNYYYTDLKNIHKASKKQVERIYNIQKSSFEGKCRSAGGDCNDVIQKMINFVENPYVKKNYVNLRGQTLAKLKSNPELIITYLDSENFKLNKADQSVLNTQLKPILQATGGGFGVVGSIGGTVYACAQTAGLGCYAAAIAGSAGATSSFDHIKTGFNNYGKPLSQQSSGDLIKNLKGLGFTDKGARNIQLAADILGTGGLGYSIAANKAVNTTSKYATSSTNVAKNTETYFRVEGGSSKTKTSQNRVTANSDGTVSINSGCAGQLCVSTKGADHTTYFLTEKRPGGNVVVFELDKNLHDFIMKEAVAQNPRYRPVGSDPNSPKIVDPTKSGNSTAFWESIRDYPGLDTSGMTDVQSSRMLYEKLLLKHELGLSIQMVANTRLERQKYKD